MEQLLSNMETNNLKISFVTATQNQKNSSFWIQYHGTNLQYI